MDLSNFKKVREEKDRATFKDESGHEIHISKSRLTPELLQQLAELPTHMEEGGEVDESALYRKALADDIASTRVGKTFIDASKGIGQAVGNLINGSEKAPAAYEAPQKAAAGPEFSLGQNAQQPQTAQYDMPQQAQSMGAAPQAQMPSAENLQLAGMNQQIAGVNAQAQAEGNLGNMQAQVAQQNIANAQALQQRYEQNYKAIDNEISGVMSDIKAGHINPNQFMEGRSGWQKAGILIGLALGGKPEMLHKAIERDVQAQVANMDKKKNLLSAQFQRMGNMKDAIDMTRVIQASIYATQLQEAAAKSSSPIAKAKAQQAIGALYAQYAPLMQDLAMRRDFAQMEQGIQPASAGGQGQPQDPRAQDQKIRSYISRLKLGGKMEQAKDIEGRYVPGIGLATTTDGGKTVREQMSQTEAVVKSIGELRKIMNTTGKSLSPTLRAKADTIRKGLVGALRVPITGPGSMSDGERELLLQMVPGVADFTSLDSRSKVRLDTLEKEVKSKTNSLLEKNGLQPTMDTAEIQYRGGVPYRKVPGGWQKVSK